MLQRAELRALKRACGCQNERQSHERKQREQRHHDQQDDAAAAVVCASRVQSPKSKVQSRRASDRAFQRGKRDPIQLAWMVKKMVG